MAESTCLMIKPGLFLFGLNYQSTPLDLRERLALTGDGPRLAHKRLLSAEVQSEVCEGTILSTCHRFEVILVASDSASARVGG